MAKLRLVVLILNVATFALPRTSAAEWPEHPVHFIVPFPPGGATDVAARVVGNFVSGRLGRRIMVENRSGANGNIAIEYVAKSAPDGYTVLVAVQDVGSNPHVYKMTIDPLKALMPVVQISRQPIVLAAHPSLGVGTLSELTALAKQQPGLQFGTGSGVGSCRPWWRCGTRSSPASRSNRCRTGVALLRSTISSPATSSSARSVRRHSFPTIRPAP
jgi:tripartite-type tricarboxylate transporter receptor subunit TctC